MTIKIRYFAGLKENIGRSEDILELTDQLTTIEEVWLTANRNKPLPSNVLAALNMEYAAMDALVKDGDEVAFFPPVTGGC